MRGWDGFKARCARVLSTASHYLSTSLFVPLSLQIRDTAKAVFFPSLDTCMYILSFYFSMYCIQADLGDIGGSVPDYRNKENIAIERVIQIFWLSGAYKS